MIRKIVALLGLLVLLLPAGLVLAGGWAVITVDELPEAIRAGETTEISFMIRAHGQAPADGLFPLLSARNEATGERVQAATIVFPSAGEWSWSIAAAPYPQRVTMAPLTVAATASAPAAPSSALDIPLVLRWAGLTLLVAALGLALVDRRRQPGDVVAVAD